MKTFAAVISATCVALAASHAMAMDDVKKDGMKPMTMQECKDHMAMAKKEGMKKDDATMKKDTMCTDMMKKDGMMKGDSAMQPDGMASAATKK